MAGPLEREIQELEHKVAHLVRSNDELRQALKEDSSDRDEYKSAIDENIVTIARWRARIASLKEQLRAMQHGSMDVDAHAPVYPPKGTWL